MLIYANWTANGLRRAELFYDWKTFCGAVFGKNCELGEMIVFNLEGNTYSEKKKSH